jgi:hypothetical protein
MLAALHHVSPRAYTHTVSNQTLTFTLCLQFWLYLISWHVGLFSVMLLGQVKRERERERERYG